MRKIAIVAAAVAVIFVFAAANAQTKPSARYSVPYGNGLHRGSAVGRSFRRCVSPTTC